jgi:hypothetical protein
MTPTATPSNTETTTPTPTPTETPTPPEHLIPNVTSVEIINTSQENLTLQAQEKHNNEVLSIREDFLNGKLPLPDGVLSFSILDLQNVILKDEKGESLEYSLFELRLNRVEGSTVVHYMKVNGVFLPVFEFILPSEIESLKASFGLKDNGKESIKEIWETFAINSEGKLSTLEGKEIEWANVKLTIQPDGRLTFEFIDKSLQAARIPTMVIYESQEKVSAVITSPEISIDAATEVLTVPPAETASLRKESDLFKINKPEDVVKGLDAYYIVVEENKRIAVLLERPQDDIFGRVAIASFDETVGEWRWVASPEGTGLSWNSAMEYAAQTCTSEPYDSTRSSGTNEKYRYIDHILTLYGIEHEYIDSASDPYLKFGNETLHFRGMFVPQKPDCYVIGIEDVNGKKVMLFLDTLKNLVVLPLKGNMP